MQLKQGGGDSFEAGRGNLSKRLLHRHHRRRFHPHCGRLLLQYDLYLCEIYDKCGGYKYPFIFDDSSQFAFLNPVCEKETQKKGEIFKSQKGVS